MENLFFNNEVRNVIAGFLASDIERGAVTMEKCVIEFAAPEFTPSYATILDYCKGLAADGIINQRDVISEGFDQLHPFVKESFFSLAPESAGYRAVARFALKFAVENERSLFALLGKGGARLGNVPSTVIRLLILDALRESPLTCSEISRRTDMHRNSVAPNLEQMARLGLVEMPPKKTNKNVYRLVKCPLELFEAEKGFHYYKHPKKGKLLDKLYAASMDGFRPDGRYAEFSVTEMVEMTGNCTVSALKRWMRKLEAKGYSVPVSRAFKKEKRELTPLGRGLAEMLDSAVRAMDDEAYAEELGRRMDDFFIEESVRDHYCAEGFRIYYSEASIPRKQGVGAVIKGGVLELAGQQDSFTASDVFGFIDCNKRTLNHVLKGMVAEGILAKQLVGRHNYYSLSARQV